MEVWKTTVLCPAFEGRAKENNLDTQRQMSLFPACAQCLPVP